MIEFSPSKVLIENAPKYNGFVSLYFDITLGLNFSVTPKTTVIFYCIILIEDYLMYKIIDNEDQLKDVYNVKNIYVLGYNKKYSNEFLTYFYNDILSYYAETTDKKQYDIEIKINLNECSVNIEFNLEKSLYVIKYESYSESLIECLLYEYFKQVSYIQDYNNKFMYSKNRFFYVKNTQISIKDFFQKYFNNTWGLFKSNNESILNIWNTKYNWYGNNILTNILYTSRNEFLLFSDEIRLPFVICEKIKKSMEI